MPAIASTTISAFFYSMSSGIIGLIYENLIPLLGIILIFFIFKFSVGMINKAIENTVNRFF